MSNVVDLPVITTLPLDPKRVLAKAAEKNLKVVVVIGEYENGDRYFASSIGDAGDVHWMAHMAMRDLDKTVDELEGK